MSCTEDIPSQISMHVTLPPSCVQVCPKYPKYFVVGTYSLQTEDQREDKDRSTTQHREGSVVLFQWTSDGLLCIQTLTQAAAILDLRFQASSTQPSNIFATVSSEGDLGIFSLDPEANTHSPLHHIMTSRCNDLSRDELFLQCNWLPAQERAIAVTTSSGQARLLVLDSTWRISHYSDIAISNTLEAWCIAFAPSEIESNATEVVSVYCGGDDSQIRYTSLSVSESTAEEKTLKIETPWPTATISRKHDAGVTAILPLPSSLPAENGRLVVTGSYDDHMRLFKINDLHASYGQMQIAELLDINLEGGVWRLDLIDIVTAESSATITILASCMHAGCRVVQLCTNNGENWSSKILGRFTEHKSMNYGSACLIAESNSLHCISTSFYDKLLCLWECKRS